MTALLPPDSHAVFFDAVGTVLFPHPDAPTVYAEAGRRGGLDLSPETVRARFLEAYLTQDLIDLAAGWVTSEERERDRWLAIVRATLRGVPDPEACFHELYEHFAKPTAWRLAHDAAEAISKLSARGFVLGIGSNYDARLWSVLDSFPELAPLRERTVVSAAVGFRKPAAEFFRELVRVAGCEPAQVLFVGDGIGNDYTGATAAGLNAVLLDERNRCPEPVRRIKRLTELTD